MMLQAIMSSMQCLLTAQFCQMSSSLSPAKKRLKKHCIILYQ